MNIGPTEFYTAAPTGSPALGLFVADEPDSPEVAEPELPIPTDLADAFAAATGWVIGFQETGASFSKRVQTGSRRPTGGRLKIVDMSPTWPARTPTVHRAKCDRIVAALNELISFQDDQESGNDADSCRF